MKSPSIIRYLLAFFAMGVASMGGGTHAADARRTQPIWYSPNSGSIATVVVGGFSPGTSNSPPQFVVPHRVPLPLSVFTLSGRFATSMTVDTFEPILRANVKPGDYVVVPDDPDLIE